MTTVAETLAEQFNAGTLCTLPHSWTSNGLTITFLTVIWDSARDILVFPDVTATKDGVALTLDLPFEIMNPQTKVLKGETTPVIDDYTGDTIDMPVPIEDPLAATEITLARMAAMFA